MLKCQNLFHLLKTGWYYIIKILIFFGTLVRERNIREKNVCKKLNLKERKLLMSFKIKLTMKEILSLIHI